MLPLTLIVSGAGFGNANGIYYRTGSTQNGQPVYQGGVGGSCTIVYLGVGFWSLSYSATQLYKFASSTSPIGVWTMLDGTNTGTNSPAPTVADGTTGPGGTGGGTTMFTGSVFEGAFLSPESSLGVLPGSPVWLALQSLTVNLQSDTPTNDVEAQGTVIPVGVTREKEMTDVDFSGDLSFLDILYVLASVICIPNVAQDATHAGVYYWDFKPRSNNPDTFQTFNVIEGQSVGASGAGGIHFNSLDLTFEEKKAAMSGKGFGQILDDTVSAPATPTYVPLVSISPADLNVYIASSFAGLGAGQIADCEGAKLSIPERKTAIKTRDARTQTYSGMVQKKLTPTAQIIVDKNTSSAAYMAQLRAKGTGYCRIEYVGPPIGATGINYRLAIDFAFKFKKSTRSEQNDQFVSTFDMGLTRDPNFLGGTWINIEVTTGLSPSVAGLTTQAGALGAGTIPTTADAGAFENSSSQQ